MRTFSVLIFGFALACTLRGGTEYQRQTTQAKTSQHPTTHAEHHASGSAHNVQPAQPHQHVGPPTVHPEQVPATWHPAQVGVAPAHFMPQGQPQVAHPEPQSHPQAAHFEPQGRPQSPPAVQPAAPPLTREQQDEVNAQAVGFRGAEQYRKWKETGRVEMPRGVVTSGAPPGQHGMTAASSSAAGSHVGLHPFPSRHFELPNARAPTSENVKFQPNSHIPECEKWRDSRYEVFRKYTAAWHDASWWRSRHSRIVFVLGGWYYWHAGYWYPAWGYDSDAVYMYDGPIYAFNDLPPDQVVANVQATLQALGYYDGPIDGILGSATRAAIANYQRDHGLYITYAIDEPTLVALGMA